MHCLGWCHTMTPFVDPTIKDVLSSRFDDLRGDSGDSTQKNAKNLMYSPEN